MGTFRYSSIIDPNILEPSSVVIDKSIVLGDSFIKSDMAFILFLASLSIEPNTVLCLNKTGTSLVKIERFLITTRPVTKPSFASLLSFGFISSYSNILIKSITCLWNGS